MITEQEFYQFVINGLFEIDDLGNVWRIAKPTTSGIIPVERHRAEQISKGYYFVAVRQGTARYNKQAHRLVWYHFFGEIPDGLTVNHKDGHKTNNHPSNLELATPQEQVIHTFQVLGRVPMQGQNHPGAKITDADIAQILSMVAGGETQRKVAKHFSLSEAEVSRIVNKKAWRHL